MWIMIIVGVLLVGSIRYLAWMKKRDKLTPNTFSIIVGSIWSLITISPFIAYASDDIHILAIGLAISIIQFALLFLASKWIYNRLGW